MDKEFKFVIGFLGFLLLLCVALLEFVAGIHFWSKDFLTGFMPFFGLVIPYVIFSSKWFTTLLRDLTFLSVWKKFVFPAYLLAIYFVSAYFTIGIHWPLALKLGLWFFLPVIIFGIGWKETEKIHYKDFIVILWVWLPIEFGQLAGYDIIFNRDIAIPALALAAPALGLYLFAVLRNLPDLGYSFMLQRKDFTTVLAGLLLLAGLLVPLGTYSQFLHFSIMRTSFWQAVEMLFGIYFLVALPEELLFRGIIQNTLQKCLGQQKFGSALGLVAGSIIFGLAHWNNFNPPDWRYVALATIAGMVYGITYMRTGKITASALVHCGVNFIWAIIFKDTVG